MLPSQIIGLDMDCFSVFDTRDFNSDFKDKDIIAPSSNLPLQTLVDSYNQMPNFTESKNMMLSQLASQPVSEDLFQLPAMPERSATRQVSNVTLSADMHPPSEAPANAVIDDYSTFLHRACQLFPNSPEIIQSALLADEEAIRRYEKLTVVNAEKKKCYIKCKMPVENKKCKMAEPYSLPINIAIKHKAELEVLKMLAEAGSDALELKDGFDGSVSISVALKLNPQDVKTFDMLLFTNPKAAMVPDRRKNYPLHIACSKGSNIEIVRQLCMIHPEALFKKNFNGDTPLKLAQKNTKCPDDVLEFLTEQSFGNSREDKPQYVDTRRVFPHAA